MSTAGIIKVSAACPVFDGTEYPYWKNKMRMHLEAIDVDLWYVVKNGVPRLEKVSLLLTSRNLFNWTLLPRISSVVTRPKDSMAV